MTKKIPPIHPGTILLKNSLEPMGITPYALAKALAVSQPRVYALVHGSRSLTADMAIRLGCYFGTQAEFWMNLQTHYDLEVQRDAAATQSAIAQIKPLQRETLSRGT